MSGPVGHAHPIPGNGFTPFMGRGESAIKAVADTGRARVRVHWDGRSPTGCAVAGHGDPRSMANGEGGGRLWRDVTGSRVTQSAMYVHGLDRPPPPPRLDGRTGRRPPGRDAAPAGAVEP